MTYFNKLSFLRYNTDMTTKNLLAHFYDEGDSAYIYTVMEQLANGKERKKIFRKLRDAEIAHQKQFADLLKKHGEKVPVYKPSYRIRFMEFFARRGAASMVLKARINDEAQEVKSYIMQKNKDSLLRDRAKDEAVHAQVLQELGAAPTQELWHHHETGGILRNAIYGFNDGLTANFGLIMGVIGSSANHNMILLSGIAGLIADTLSMGSSSYLAAISEKEVYEHEIKLEKEEIELMPQQEEDELALIYQAKGFSESLAKKIAHDIMTGSKEIALQEKVVQELGITSSEAKPLNEGMITGAATLFGAAIPLIPLFFGSTLPFIIASFVISMAFHFMVGAVRSAFTGRSIFRSGLDMFIVGLGVAVGGYIIGYLITGTFSK